MWHLSGIRVSATVPNLKPGLIKGEEFNTLLYLSGKLITGLPSHSWHSKKRLWNYLIQLYEAKLSTIYCFTSAINPEYGGYPWYHLFLPTCEHSALVTFLFPFECRVWFLLSISFSTVGYYIIFQFCSISIWLLSFGAGRWGSASRNSIFKP